MKLSKLCLVSLVALLVGFGCTKKTDTSQTDNQQTTQTINNTNSKNYLPSPDRLYITANPIDLGQVEKISKFRSCAGHDSSGHNFMGQVETDRSMKHYVNPIAAFEDDKAAFYAPFDGTVYFVDGPHPEQGPGRARGGELDLISPLELHAVVELGHINAIATLKKGDAVKSGQFLGYAATAGGSGNDFDLVVRAINQPPPISNYDTFDSVFNHMTPEVLAEYAKFGLTKEAMFFSKEFRDGHPCLFATVAAEPNERTGPQPEIQTSADNWVFLPGQ